jgi:hypothetical protein
MTMQVNYSEVKKARRFKLLRYYRVQRHIAVSMNTYDILDGPQATSTRWGEPYTGYTGSSLTA